MGSVSKWVLALLLGVAVASGFPASEEYDARVNQDLSTDSESLIEDGIDTVYRFIQSCGEKDMSLCLKMRALTFVDRQLRRTSDMKLLEGVSLVRAEDALDVSRELNGRALSEAELEASLPQNADEKDAQVETLLVDRIAKFLQGHTLQFKVPDSAISEVKKTLDEGKFLLCSPNYAH
jgi:hypothetical protein